MIGNFIVMISAFFSGITFKVCWVATFFSPGGNQFEIVVYDTPHTHALFEIYSKQELTRFFFSFFPPFGGLPIINDFQFPNGFFFFLVYYH